MRISTTLKTKVNSHMYLTYPPDCNQRARRKTGAKAQLQSSANDSCGLCLFIVKLGEYLGNTNQVCSKGVVRIRITALRRGT